MIYGFSFIGFPIEYDAKLPFVLCENLRIDKPTERQLKVLRNYLDDLNPSEPFKDPFETKITVKQEENIGHIPVYVIQTTPREKKDWLYSVVKFKSTPEGYENISPDIFDLCLASLICEKDFMILYSFVNRPGFGFGNNLEATNHLEQIHTDEKEYKWDKSDLLNLKKIHSGVLFVRDNYPDIYHSLKLYQGIPKIVGYNELICLGLFSIIESVLTHNPKSATDSIGHQIKTKVKLLSKRFDKEVDCSDFENVPIDTLWKKLYDLRSRIAHGGKIDFQKEFQLLRGSYEVQVFLEKFLKTLLRNSLIEPQLYTDLKEC